MPPLLDGRSGLPGAALGGGVNRRALVLFLAMSLIWGVPYLFIRIAVQEISPATLVFARTAIGSLILLPIALLRVDLRPVLRRWRWVVAFAVVEVGGPWVLLGSAEQHLTSSLAGLLVAGVPLVGTVIAVATRGRDRIDRRGLAGLLVGLAGVAAIVGSSLGVSDGTALLEMAVVVLGYAVGPAILARRLGGLPPVGVQALALSLCALAYAPIAAVQRPAVLPSPSALAAIAILGVVCTATAFVVFSWLIEEIGPVRATVITYVNPAVAAVLGVLVLSEQFTVAMGAGLALVILGSTLAARRTASAAEEPGSTFTVELEPEPGVEREPEPAA
jgi:drug/metabolite transporter (DMT)-like permease